MSETTTTPTPANEQQDVRERAGRALYEHRQVAELGYPQDGYTAWDELPEDWQDEYREAADAVLAAVSAAAPDEREALASLRALLAAGEASDGHHTHRELYDYRMLYNAHAARGWLAAGLPVVKSWHHSDGEPCFGGGWFIVVATLPTGQVSNHYRAEHWDLFDVPEVALPPDYDGHTPADAADRLRAALAARPEPTVSTAAPDERATDPLIVSAIRRHPSGTLRYEPANGPATGTSGRSFLAEYDAALAARPAPGVNAGPLQVEYGLVWDDIGSTDTFPTLEQARAAGRGFDEPAQVVRIETWPVADEGRAGA